MTTTTPTTESGPAGRDAFIEHLGWNIQHGRHLATALDLLEQRTERTGWRPDLLSLQELQPGQGEAVSERLGMTFVAAPPNLRPGSETALFYNPARFREDPSWTQYPSGIRHNPAVALLWMLHPVTGEQSSRQLFVASEHSSYSDPGLRERQARFYSELAKDQRLLLVQGDWNGWPVRGCPVSLDRVADRAYAQNRTVLTPDGMMRPDDQADRLLTYGGMTDVGHYAATALGIEGADRPTTGHGPDKDRQRVPAEDLPPGGIGPIDRHYASAELMPALTGYEVITDPGFLAVSDHGPTRSLWVEAGLWEVMDRGVRLVRH